MNPFSLESKTILVTGASIICLCILFDTGIHQRLLDLDIAQILVADDFGTVNKGTIADVCGTRTAERS
jgi:hypothetical protein